MQDFIRGFTSAFMINVNWASVGEFLGSILLVIFGCVVFLLVFKVLSNLLISYLEKEIAKLKGSLEYRYATAVSLIEELETRNKELTEKVKNLEYEIEK